MECIDVLPTVEHVHFSTRLSVLDFSNEFPYAERRAQQIYSSQLNGEDRKQLTKSTGISNWPCYSPDGRSIVFSSSRDGNFEIYRMNADGSDVRRLTENPF